MKHICLRAYKMDEVMKGESRNQKLSEDKKYRIRKILNYDFSIIMDCDRDYDHHHD